MTAPVIVAEPCGCQIIEHPDLDSDEYRAWPDREQLDAWLDERVEAWRDGAITALAHGGGVLTLQRNVGGKDPVIHRPGSFDDAHVAQMVLTLNTDPPPLPER